MAILAVVVLFATTGGTVAQAAGRSRASGPAMLQLKFRRVVKATPEDVQAVLASKQYVVVQLFYDRYLVYNDDRGKSWRIDTRPCGDAGWPRDPPPFGLGSFGAPWVMFICSTGFALYNVVDRNWRRVGGGSAGLAFEDASAFEVGAFWIKLVYTGGQDCGDHVHYDCGVSYRFYNIRSRRLRSSPPMTSGTVFDLDSPSLVRHLCEPLEAPPVDQFGAPMGSLALYGKFALDFAPYDIGFLNNTAPLTSAPRGGRGEWNLERCGSNLRLSIDAQNQGQTLGALTANDQAVLWSVIRPGGRWTGEIAGRFLPSLRRFDASVPRGVAGPGADPPRPPVDGAVLDSSQLYVVDEARATIWRAPFPP